MMARRKTTTLAVVMASEPYVDIDRICVLVSRSWSSEMIDKRGHLVGPDLLFVIPRQDGPHEICAWNERVARGGAEEGRTGEALFDLFLALLQSTPRVSLVVLGQMVPPDELGEARDVGIGPARLALQQVVALAL
jgi:hypothetical protein